ncbi:hypothetical protein AMTRI_Chr13g88690 [Amborella trichopoda]
MGEDSHAQTVRERKRKKLKVELDVAEALDSYIAPCVGYFPSGFDPLRHNKNDGELKIKAYRAVPNYKSWCMQVVVSPEGSNVDFVGTNYTGEAAVSQSCSYALGVLDKEKQILTVVPIAGDKVFRMEPRVRGLQYEDAVYEEPKEVENTPQIKRSDKIRNLTLNFGTRQAKHSSMKRAAAFMKEEDLGTQEGLEAYVSEVGKSTSVMTKTEALYQATKQVVRNIPPYDTEATTPDKAYLLDKIISPNEWAELSDVMELVEVGSCGASALKFKMQNDYYPCFVRNRVGNIKKVHDIEEKKKLACIFSYITHLLEFLALQTENELLRRLLKAQSQAIYDLGEEGKKIFGAGFRIPGMVLVNFLNTFFADRKEKFTKEKNDMVISYILVLTLFADGFTTDPSDICKDLKMKLPTLRKSYLELGCKLSTAKTGSIVTLPAPLKFPTLTTPYRRRK